MPTQRSGVCAPKHAVFNRTSSISRRVIVAGIAAVALCLSTAASAADWPSKTIRLVVAYPPGGGTDIVARLLAEDLTERLGVGVLVDNRGGAAGRLGTAFVAQSPPDGNTVLFGSVGELTMAPATVSAMPYDPLKDLEPITQIAGGPYVLVASPAFPPNTLAELIAYSKSHPGKVNFSSGGTYGSVHLVTLQFDQKVGIDALHVPYRGSGPALLGVMSGDAQFTLNTPAATIDLIKAHKLKIIAVASTHRLAAFPDTPTISESGFPGFVGGSWYGLLVPLGTPKPIVDRLHDETVRFLGLPKTRKALESLYIEPIGSSPAEFGQFMASDIDRYRKLMSSMNLKPE
jgi:tripartite-type tricarboxylate transporter receptor subunit TctC